MSPIVAPQVSALGIFQYWVSSPPSEVVGIIAGAIAPVLRLGVVHVLPGALLRAQSAKIHRVIVVAGPILQHAIHIGLGLSLHQFLEAILEVPHLLKADVPVQRHLHVVVHQRQAPAIGHLRRKSAGRRGAPRIHEFLRGVGPQLLVVVVGGLLHEPASRHSAHLLLLGVFRWHRTARERVRPGVVRLVDPEIPGAQDIVQLKWRWVR
mmetsp:Transcript_10373/g.24440  ORF Transcript_10373/g.24440 Transcript_10373/m.24440 type:complete len:208 (+) Transcript_10373:546-1169(+)